ncbi:MAG: hypothetical protein IKD13_05855 [Firmicutes bacterium]|nr:hypothetical protein [Bacillota bacterium]
MNTSNIQNEYAYFLSFSSFIGTFFFLGVYLELLHTLWLSLLLAGILLWLVLTLFLQLGRKNPSSLRKTPLVRRPLALAAIAYGGFSLCGFFFFCQQCIFPSQGFWFFPVCFLGITTLGGFGRIHTLERTAKFTTAIIGILLLLTAVSMVQKLWSETAFLKATWMDLFRFDSRYFLLETGLVFVILLVQALILILVLEQPKEITFFLCSIRKALIPSVLCSSLLHLIAVLALGTHTFEHLTWPIYDMLSLPGYAEYLDRTELLMLLICLFCESVKTIAFFRAGRGLFARQSRG